MKIAMIPNEGSLMINCSGLGLATDRVPKSLYQNVFKKGFTGERRSFDRLSSTILYKRLILNEKNGFWKPVITDRMVSKIAKIKPIDSLGQDARAG